MGGLGKLVSNRTYETECFPLPGLGPLGTRSQVQVPVLTAWRGLGGIGLTPEYSRPFAQWRPGEVSPGPPPVRRALNRGRNHQLPLPRATPPECPLPARAREPLRKAPCRPPTPHLWHTAPKDFTRELDVGLDRVSQKDREDTAYTTSPSRHFGRHFSTLPHLQGNDIIHTHRTDGEY